MLIHEELTREIRGAAMEVHAALGPGLLESVYNACLCHELHIRGIAFTREIELPVRYKNVHLDCGYRIDMVVADAVLLELKSMDALLPIHEAQLLTYMRLSGKKVGLLINFNVPLLKDGIIRRVL